MATNYAKYIAKLQSIPTLTIPKTHNISFYQLNPFVKPAGFDLQTLADTPLVLPNVLQQHALSPSKLKVQGIRIQIKGRRGPRSVKQVLQYGVLSFSKHSGVTTGKVDYGQSVYVGKNGSTGVKVYISYI